ncbi:MAG: Calx-beta domain-containing protein [Chitinophagales bacterium]
MQKLWALTAFFVLGSMLHAIAQPKLTAHFIPRSYLVPESVDTFTVCIELNNTDTVPIPWFLRTLFPSDDPKVTAQGGPDYFFDWGFHLAPPGISSFCQIFRVNDDPTPEHTECVYAIAVDSTGSGIVYDSLQVCITDNDYQPVAIRFGDTAITVWEDTAPRLLIPVYFDNPNNFDIYYLPVPDLPQNTATAGVDYVYDGTIAFHHGNGSWVDTFVMNVMNDDIAEPTEEVYFRLGCDWTKRNVDTTFHLTILDTDSPYVTFFGAQYSYDESAGSGVVKIMNTSPLNYPFTVSVFYSGGNATRNVDFVYNDTTLVFPANQLDTQEVVVRIIDDQVDESNEQVLLDLIDIQPNVRTLIREFTFTIVDNDTAYAGINAIDIDENPIVLNPFHKILQLRTETGEHKQWQVSSMDGSILAFGIADGLVNIDASCWPTGYYVISVTDAHRTWRGRAVKAEP